MKTFKLIRIQDVSGVSGTGEVAVGSVLDNGLCIITWTSAATLADGSKKQVQSVSVYNTLEDAVLIHGHSGRTMFKLDDGIELTDLMLLKASNIGTETPFKTSVVSVCPA